jgi:protein-disulfide isomerase
MAFIGQESMWAAEASECANEQGRFWEYHDKLFAEQAGENRGTFSKSNLKRFADQIGLDTATFNACLDSDKHKATVQRDIDDGVREGVRQTPTLFINTIKIEGVPSFDALQQAIEKAASTGGR